MPTHSRVSARKWLIPDGTETTPRAAHIAEHDLITKPDAPPGAYPKTTSTAPTVRLPLRRIR